MRRIILTGSLLLALSGSVMASQVYKWVDAQGVTHFGAQPPQGQDATSVSTGAAQPKEVKPTFENPYPVQPKAEEKAATPAPAKPGKASSDEQQKALDEKVKSDVAKQEAERKKYCDTMRTNLAQLQNNPRVRVEENGQLRFLGEEERQAKMAETKKSIDENCN
ncbi:hypothetical protein PSm6_12040 [Pseudomonas solani]|uniref:DUF4124 domain-containing protein n=1 Tax=Pseudomonas solani TaxID=2731552 RepID=A0AAU7Y177_9PSED|nr:DUF4124 domain-containing protein [Pseudomonas solani]MBB4821716.1 type IV secretory pathway VirB10-like protein [Pseudomonas alcaligenes]BCD84797.1 hypothetical protein PSm6_12040 [Pseudomonas solani]